MADEEVNPCAHCGTRATLSYKIDNGKIVLFIQCNNYEECGAQITYDLFPRPLEMAISTLKNVWNKRAEINNG